MQERLLDLPVYRAADVSSDGRYRYVLYRRWYRIPKLTTWVLLNPSTADAQLDDPTIRRIMGFSERWGYGGVVVVNLFALRATDPRELRRTEDPVGPKNNDVLRECIACSTGRVVVAWGADTVAKTRAEWIRSIARPGSLQCLGTNAGGSPKHPLYLSRETEPEPW